MIALAISYKYNELVVHCHVGSLVISCSNTSNSSNTTCILLTEKNYVTAFRKSWTMQNLAYQYIVYVTIFSYDCITRLIIKRD